MIGEPHPDHLLQDAARPKRGLHDIFKQMGQLLRRRDTELPTATKTPAKEVLPIPETVEVQRPKTYLQKLGEQPLVSLDEWLNLPEETNTSLGVIADLVANNGFTRETEEVLKNLHVKGNLVGIGVASIFGMLEGFDECASLTSIDIHPSPVAIGRLLNELFIEQENFADFLTALANKSKVTEVLQQIGLPEKYLTTALQSLKEATQMFAQAQDPRDPYIKIDGIHVKQGDLRNLFPLEIIRQHYEQLRTLALGGNLIFIQENFFNPRLWTEIQTHQPEIADAQNIVFLSNGIDHVSRSKVKLWSKWQSEGKNAYIREEQNMIGKIVDHNFQKWEKSRFVFTLTSLKYNLHISDTPPVFDLTDNGEVMLADLLE